MSLTAYYFVHYDSQKVLSTQKNLKRQTFALCDKKFQIIAASRNFCKTDVSVKYFSFYGG